MLFRSVARVAESSTTTLRVLVMSATPPTAAACAPKKLPRTVLPAPIVPSLAVTESLLKFEPVMVSLRRVWSVPLWLTTAPADDRAEVLARELVRAAVATVADGYLSHLDTRQVVEWFDLGGSLPLSDTMAGAAVVAHAHDVQGLIELAHEAGIPKDADAPLLASGIDFVLEGLYALKKLSRSDERGYHASEPPARRPSREQPPADPPMPTAPGSKKKYYKIGRAHV